MKSKIQKTIYLGSDHAGYKLKEKIELWLVKKDIPFIDLGNIRFQKTDDYPDYAKRVATEVVKNKSLGVLVCGSAEGMCIAANKIKGSRAVNPHTPLLAKLSREHNDANIICLSGGGTIKPIPGTSLSNAKKMLEIFLNTKFSKAARHKRRVNKIKQLER